VRGPSLRFTKVGLFGDMPTTRTEYICGLNTRSESRSCNGHSDITPPTNVRYEYGPLRAHIYNRDLNYRFELELANRIYTACHVNEGGNPKWIKPLQLKSQKPSGRTIHFHTETIDTGERKEVFGYAARRVITRSRRTRDLQVLSESECEGWYIDPPAAWLNLHPPAGPGAFYHLSSATGERDDYKFTEAGKRETGFVLLSTRRNKTYSQDQTGNLREHEGIHHDEITEFSEAPLEPDLFVPPSDFKRVLQLPDGMRCPPAYRMRLRWESLKDSLSGRFRK
jgi:hypothetical protein